MVRECPDRFSRPHYDHHCIKERCAAFIVRDIRDPPRYRLETFYDESKDPKIVAHRPWCKKYNSWVGEEVAVET